MYRQAVGSTRTAGNRQHNDISDKCLPPVEGKMTRQFPLGAQCTAVVLGALSPAPCLFLEGLWVSSPFLQFTRTFRVIAISLWPVKVSVLFYSFFQCSSPVSVDLSSSLVWVVKYRPILSLSWESETGKERERDRAGKGKLRVAGMSCCYKRATLE